MAQSAFRRPLWWSEPAHPGIVQQLSDLISLYRAIRDRIQPRIDQAFDAASRQVGFVVVTTLPVTIHVDGEAKITAVAVGGAHHQDTVFGRELSKAFEPLVGSRVDGVSAGSYELYAIWSSALALVLQHHWLEPAHPGIDPRTAGQAPVQSQALRPPPGVHEPAHFLDATLQLAPEETTIITAIDEVYPELRLAERIATARSASRPLAVSAYVKEPPHFRPTSLFENDQFITELRQLVQKFGGG